MVAMFPDPLKQGSLKTNVVADFFRFQPLVLQDFIAFSKKFLVQTRAVGQVLNGLFGRAVGFHLSGR